MVKRTKMLLTSIIGVLTVLTLVSFNWAATISGSIHYGGTSAGKIFVEVANTPPPSPPLFGQFLPCTGAGDYPYSLSNNILITGSTYYLRAYLDMDGNNRPDPNEPKGEMSSPVVIVSDPATGVNFPIAEVGGGLGSVSGFVTYNGVSPDSCVIYVSTSPKYDVLYSTQVANIISSGSFSYRIGLPAGGYYLYAFIDENVNRLYDDGEPRGFFNGTAFVNNGAEAFGVNISVSDPLNASGFTLRGKITDNSGTNPAIGGAEVGLYDTQGQYDQSKYTLFATAVSSGGWNGAPPDVYNYEFTGIYPPNANYPYVVRARAAGKISNPRDQWVYFNSPDPTQIVFYTGPIIMEDAPRLDLSNVYVDNGVDGVDGSTDTVAITPDNDGNKDFANISFRVNASTTNFFGAQCRVIVDTNRLGGFSPFDWSQITWDQQGNPMWGNPPQKHTWQELNNLQAQSDWTFDNWVSPGEISATGYVDKKIRWEGRDNNWNVLPSGIYDASIQLGFDLRETFNSSATVHINVQTTEISGSIYYETSGSTLPIAGARVEAGGMNGWGQAYSDSNGNYKIGGLRTGAYFVRVQVVGFSNEERQDVPAPSSGVNFALSKGGTISGNVTLPSAFNGSVDQWGNTIQQLWGNIEAWDDSTGKRGFTNFQINLGTDTATYALTLQPGTYRVRAWAQGYVARESTGVAVTSYGTTLNLALGEAIKITGVVAVPTAISTGTMQGLWVNVNAHSLNNRNFGWGGAQIMQGKTSAQFEISNLPPDDLTNYASDYAKDNTYELRFNAMGYADYLSTGVVVGSSGTITLPTLITLDKGQSISGNITFSGDTTQLNSYIWINAHGIRTNHWSGFQVLIPKSSTGCVTAFELSGLINNEEYELNSWVMGFEMADQPFKVSAPATGVNVVFNPYTGKISGQVSATTAAIQSYAIDYSNVIVTAQLAWWGDQNKQPQLSRVDPVTGVFSITGLGTGEYIVTANEYAVAPSSSPPFHWQGKPTGRFAAVIDRVMVANGATTDVLLELNQPSRIGGTVTNLSSAVISSTNNVSGLRMIAVPQKMAWMGLKENFMMYSAPISTYTVNDSSYTYAYIIGGLPADTYIVKPFLHQNTDPRQSPEEWQRNDLGVVEQKIIGVGLNDNSKVSVNFVLTNGFTVSGNVQRPQVDDNDHWYGIDLFKANQEHQPIAMTQIKFTRQDETISDRSQNFSFAHVVPGNYFVRIWTNGDYKQISQEVEVTNQDVTVPTIILAKGAAIKGTLVDAESGGAISGKNGAVVQCEARPWVEGSWMQTRNDEWAGELRINEQTGEFKLPNLVPGSYIVRVRFDNMDPMLRSSSSGSKSYAGTVIAGVTVPDSTEEVNLGTIKLSPGKTISGTITDINNRRLANILVVAQPSTSKGESIRVETKSDATGYYTLQGVNADIKYWTVTAAARGDWFEMRPSRYGEVIKDSIAPGTTNVDFVLQEAKAIVSGKVVAPDGVELGLPFPGENLPVAMVLLQNAGIIYDDPMGGIELITTPDGRFEAGGIVPGNYLVKVMSKGLATTILEKTVAEGRNDLGNITLAKGGGVGGTILDKQGNKVSTTKVNMALAVEEATFGLTFGVLDADDLSKEINSYLITGLVPGKTYRVILISEDGGDEDIFVSTATVSVSSVDETVTMNLVYEEQPPSFIVQVARTATRQFKIKIFSTKIIADTDATAVLRSDGRGTFNDSENVETRFISDDKQDIEGVYIAGYTDAANTVLESSFTLTISAKDLSGLGTTVYYTVNTGMKIQNQGKFNPLVGGTVKVGEGDSSSLYVPSGAPNVASTSTVVTTVAAVDASEFIQAAPKYGPSYYSFVLPAISYANTPGDLKSDVYDMEMKLASGVLATVRSGKTVKVTCQFSEVTSTQTAKLDICYYDESQSPAVWVKEKTSRSVDSTNNTLSVDANHLSKFAAFVDVTAPSTPGTFAASSVAGNSVYLSWSGVSNYDLAGYNVYRSTDNTTYTLIATVGKTVTTYTDSGLNQTLTYYYKVSAFDDASTSNESSLSIARSVTGAYAGPFRTYVYPNPWKPKKDGNLHIRYFLPLATGKSKVEIKIYNLAGELVRKIDNGDQDNGQAYDETWDGKNDEGEAVASGVYLYHLKAGDNEEVKKIGLIK